MPISSNNRNGVPPLLAYILKRLVQGVITVWFIATATFIAMHAVPGDPLTSEKATTPEIRKNLEARYGLNRPVTEQYFIYMRNLLKGDFGISFTQQNRRVNDIIREHFPVSATLGILAIVFAALRRHLVGRADSDLPQSAAGSHHHVPCDPGISVPSFVVAAVSQLSIVNINSAADHAVLPVAGWGTLCT
jgi:ABC-type dipeptide/oligopeptide/nickel transport system permease component